MSAGSDISVIIPTKDRALSLEKVIPSYLMQPEVAELIVVDDGSTDCTVETVKRLSLTDPRLRIVRHSRNRGIPAAKNSGIDAARYPLTFFGEDDLELTAGYLATLLAHRARSAADVISGRNVWRFEHESGAEALRRAAARGATAVDRKRIAIDQNLALPDDTDELLLAATMLAATDLFRRVRFDEGYRANGWREESDFQLRAVASGARLVACPHAISFNYMLANDRGGAHAVAGLTRVYWMARNTDRFLRANRTIIAREFHIRNNYLYMARLVATAVWREIALPRAVTAVRAIGPLIHRQSLP
jgi:glycosyltransferase involved in cell wall biosynthesis